MGFAPLYCRQPPKGAISGLLRQRRIELPERQECERRVIDARKADMEGCRPGSRWLLRADESFGTSTHAPHRKEAQCRIFNGCSGAQAGEYRIAKLHSRIVRVVASNAADVTHDSEGCSLRLHREGWSECSRQLSLRDARRSLSGAEMAS